ncbi:MAG: HEPN domain-containing protein [Candidatus Aenigmatarchaeota archaeon]
MKTNLEIKKIDKNLRNKLCRAVAETTYNVFGVKLPSKKIWRFTLILFKEIKESTLDSVNDLLFIAKQDFEASQVLYDKKLYCQSVYHLQQCVEKITKAFGLWTGLIEEKELYQRKQKKSMFSRIFSFFGLHEKEESIGHISPKTFVLLLKKKFIKEYFDFINLQTKNNELKTLIKNYNGELKSFERLINKRKKLAILSKNEISGFLKLSYNYQNIFAKIDKRRLKTLLNEFKMGIRSRFEKILPPDTFVEVDKKLTKLEDRIEYMFIGFNTFSFLYPLTIISYPHFTYTRYPTKELKPQDYTENLGIVTLLPEILTHVEYIIRNFESLIEKS